MNDFRALDYRYSVTVASEGGRVLTTLRSTTSLNTWTRKPRRRKPGGVTVRLDHSKTYRFDNSVIVERTEV